jgi:N-methylhydantoinase A
VLLEDGVGLDAVNDRFREMVHEGIRVLEQEDIPHALMQFRRSVDMRYVGQEYTINMPLGDEFLSHRTARELRDTFHLSHQRTYGHASPTEPTELVNLRVAAIGEVKRPELRTRERARLHPEASAQVDEVHMYSQGDRVWIRTPVYDRAQLGAGNRIEGPALIVEKGATTVVELGFEIEVKGRGQLKLTRGH